MVNIAMETLIQKNHLKLLFLVSCYSYNFELLEASIYIPLNNIIWMHIQCIATCNYICTCNHTCIHACSQLLCHITPYIACVTIYTDRTPLTIHTQCDVTRGCYCWACVNCYLTVVHLALIVCRQLWYIVKYSSSALCNVCS